MRGTVPRGNVTEIRTVMDPTSAALVLPGSEAARIFVTCEHASEHFPDPWRLGPSDGWLAGTHWAYDIGAESIARAVAAHLGAVAVLSRFSRLVADPNRAETDPDLIRDTAEGRPIALNQGVRSEDRARRLALWNGYHDAVSANLARSNATILFSLHTFTPVYAKTPRRLEVGVLSNRDEHLGSRLCTALSSAGFLALQNEPYSGKEGLMYAADRHSARHGCRALELEVRQDLAVDRAFRKRLVEVLAQTLSVIAV
jgi:predicted N-formylglutamate amidohydrolase